MLKKRVIAAAMFFMLLVSMLSGTVQGYASEVSTTAVTNLVLTKEDFRTVEMVAGGTMHVVQEFTVREGYGINPVFTLTPKNDAPLKFSNITIRNKDDYMSPQLVYIDSYSEIVLEYDITVDEFAQIGSYEYAVSYYLLEEWVDDLEEQPEPGEVMMNVRVVSEKTPPQISVVAGGEVSCKAGETVNLSVTLRNDGELQAMNTYVFADYTDYETVLIPDYTPLNQKIGNLKTGQEKVITLSYKIAENATTQRIKLPLDITFKTADGLSASENNAYVYLYIEGTEVDTTAETGIPVISDVSQSPEQPKAGETMTVSFFLANDGTAEMRDTRVVLEGLGKGGFLPLSAEPHVKVGTVAAGETKKVELQVKVGEDIPSGFNKLAIIIEYQGKSADGAYVAMEKSEELYILNVQNPEEEEPEKETLKSAAPYIKSVTQSPERPKAGEKLTVSFYVVNDGEVEIREAKIVLSNLGDTGFLPTSAEPYINIGTIAAGSKKKVDLKVQVGDKIPEGFNRLNFIIEYQGMNEVGNYLRMEEPVELYILNVQNPEEDQTISRPKLMVSNFYTDVEEVKAGSIFDFTFEILNTNDSIAAKNIKVTVSGASNAFSVTAGGNSFFVDEILPQQAEPITINLKASAAATTGAYPITIKIEYEYEGIKVTENYSGETVQEEILLQVKENLRPSVENVYVGSWDTPMVNQPTTMSFEFYNMGKSTLNNTYVTIEGDFMLSNGSNSYYIGNISAGMPEYIEFDVVPLIEGDAKGKMIIHMEDSNGDEVTMEKEFTAYIMGEMAWEDMNYMDPGYMDPGMYEDPSMQTGSDAVEKPILPLWLFLCIQGAILVIVIPVTRAVRLSAYRNKIRREDAI